MKLKNRCAHCGCRYTPNPRIKNQSYCGKPGCQSARKAKWQGEKMESDPDYRMNQDECRESWLERRPDYWGQYRRNHPEYTQRNRDLQKNRDLKRRAVRLAKMDASKKEYVLKPGSYYVFPADPDLAKMDASIHKMTIIPESYMGQSESCKKGLDVPGRGRGV